MSLICKRCSSMGIFRNLNFEASGDVALPESQSFLCHEFVGKLIEKLTCVVQMLVRQRIKNNASVYLLVLLVTSQFCRTLSRTAGIYNLKEYKSDTEVFNVVVDSDNDDVFVGARNAILKFDKNFDLVQNVTTGPKLDDPRCPPYPAPCEKKRKLKDNDNKILLTYKPPNLSILLACGSVDRGRCSIFPTDNILRNRTVGDEDPVNFIAGSKSTVAFFAPTFGNRTALFSASTYDGRSFHLATPAVSSKVFVRHKDNGIPTLYFNYSYHTDTTVTSLDFPDQQTKRTYKVNYVYGFSYGGFSYFVTTQKAGLKSTVYETRLARVCQDDVRFFSYMEVPIRCVKDGWGYNMATAAYLGHAGPNLKRTLRLNHSEKILYVAFTRAPSGERWEIINGSVVCSFPMSTIITSFTDAVQECFNATKRAKRLQVFLPKDEHSCQQRDDVDIGDDFCGSAFNRYIEGPEAIQGGLRIKSDRIITALAVTIQKTDTVAILGTDDGHVIKIQLDRQSEQMLYQKHITPDDMYNSKNRSIRSSVAFDKRHDNIYFLTTYKVVKFPIGSCSPYTKCKECVLTRDPLNCHWCGSKCAHYDECEKPDLITNSTCTPIIYNFEPRSGPIEGGTKVTITGDNFGSSQSGPKANITVKIGDVECSIIEWVYERIVCETQPVNAKGEYKIFIKVVDLEYVHGSFDIKGSIESEELFRFEIPTIFRASPKRGPASGGTKIIIEGENLNVGLEKNVLVAGINCTINKSRSNERYIECLTNPHPDYSRMPEKFHRYGPIEVQIDNAKIRLQEISENQSEIITGPLKSDFQYLEDPIITNISPQAAIVSGGTVLTVEGSNLMSVKDPQLVITVVTSKANGKQQKIIQNCKFADQEGTMMTCAVPPLTNIPKMSPPTASLPIQAHVGFKMDGVKTLEDMDTYNSDLSVLLYYPDPHFYDYKVQGNVVEVPRNDPYLTLRGNNLNLALRPEDYTVAIESMGRCEVTKLSRETLRCRLPEIESYELEIYNESHNAITVVVGNLKFDPGFVRFVGKVSLVGPSSPGPVTAIVIPVFIIILLLVILFLYIRYRRRWQKKRQLNMTVAFTAAGREGDVNRCRQEPNDYQTFNPGDRENQQPLLTGQQMASNQIDSETMQLLHAENILIAREYLALEDVIGQGHFGCVHKGTLQLPGKDEVVSVAVKTLNSNVPRMEQNVEAFLQEGLMMKDFHHHNVLTLIGVSFESNNTPLVIIPFMANGDLLSYIRNESNSPTVKDLLQFGVQIAEGMKYLAELKFVHRDLAARNCMLDEDLTVKVADFGLSRDIYEREYYSSDNKKTKLPVKWMAPESLEKGTYNSKTDVWSYGVLLWELMTRGVTPYPDVDNWDILHYLKQGRRMPQPSYCPDLLYRIMLLCWDEDPKKRPPFSELAEDVQSVITKLEQKSKQKRVGLDVTYVNYPPPSTSAEQTQGASEVM